MGRATMCNNNDTDNETALENPIKVRFTGLARQKLGGWALDFEGMHAYTRANERQKTQLVIKTVEEAEEVAGFMNKVIDEGGEHGRTWVNGSVDKAGQRVQREVVNAMAERGFEVINMTDVYGLRFEPREEIEHPVEAGDKVRDNMSEETGTVDRVEDGIAYVNFDGRTGATAVDSILGEDGLWELVDEDDDEEPRTDGGTHEATDAEVREAIEAAEERRGTLVTDGGTTDDAPDVSTERYNEALRALRETDGVREAELAMGYGDQPIYMRVVMEGESTEPLVIGTGHPHVLMEHNLTIGSATMEDGHLRVALSFLDVKHYNRTHSVSAFDVARKERRNE